MALLPSLHVKIWEIDQGAQNRDVLHLDFDVDSQVLGLSINDGVEIYLDLDHLCNAVDAIKAINKSDSS